MNHLTGPGLLQTADAVEVDSLVNLGHVLGNNRRCWSSKRRNSFLAIRQRVPLESHAYNVWVSLGSQPVWSSTCQKNSPGASIFGISQGKKWWLGVEPFFRWMAIPWTRTGFDPTFVTETVSAGGNWRFLSSTRNIVCTFRCPLKWMSRRTFQLRAIVATIAPHQATTSLRQTSEDASFSSQGGIIANATLALGGARYEFAVRSLWKGRNLPARSSCPTDNWGPDPRQQKDPSWGYSEVHGNLLCGSKRTLSPFDTYPTQGGTARVPRRASVGTSVPGNWCPCRDQQLLDSGLRSFTQICDPNHRPLFFPARLSRQSAIGWGHGRTQPDSHRSH